MDEILGIVTNLYYTSGLKRISTVYKDMVNNRKNLDEWAFHFTSNLSSFREVLGDFDKSNVTEYLEKVFKQNCSTSLDAMYKTFRYIIKDYIKLYMVPLINYFFLYLMNGVSCREASSIFKNFFN